MRERQKRTEKADGKSRFLASLGMTRRQEALKTDSSLGMTKRGGRAEERFLGAKLAPREEVLASLGMTSG